MSGTKDTKKIVFHVNTTQTAMPKSGQKVRQKVLLPTLKEQQRYVVYKILSGKNGADKGRNPFGDFASVHSNILQQCNAVLGMFDGGKAGLMGVKYNPSKMSGVIRVSNKYVDKLKICLGLIKTINGNDVTVDCVSVSGMLNKAVDRMDD